MLHAPSILLEGMTGSGKTHSIHTLVEAGITPFCIFTEPGMEVVADIPSDKLHWMYIPPGTGGSWDALEDKAKKLTNMSWDQMLKYQDTKKKEYDSYAKLIHAFANFTCDRTGEEFGDVTEWGPDRALVLDSLSGLNKMCQQLIIGGNISISQPQWGAMMGQELGLIDKLCLDTQCFFVMTAHLERLQDDVNGGWVIQCNALGRKNAPEIPKNFSDVILCKKEGSRWTWCTEDANADLKARNLPHSKSLPPDFGQIVETYRSKES